MLLLALLLAAVAEGAAAPAAPPAPDAAGAAVAGEAPAAPLVPAADDADPLAGVEPRGRYQVIRPRLSAEGTVTRVRAAADGKVELLLRPEPRYMPLVGERNFDLAGGHLVVGVLPRDRGRVAIPGAGARVRVTGAYVLDTRTGWRAIEPAQEIERVR